MTATVSTQDETEIRQLVGEQVEGMRNRDAEALLRRYSEDAVVFNLAPPLGRRGAEVHDPDGMNQWFAGFDGPIDYEIRDLEVTVGGDVAFCHSLNRMSAVPHGSPVGFDLWLRATTCLRKVDGAWTITHEHTSTPFHMDGSFRAAVDLQP